MRSLRFPHLLESAKCLDAREANQYCWNYNLPEEIEAQMKTKQIFDRILEAALSKPASVIIANDVVHFRDPDDIAYKIGIQSTNSKYLKGFCYMFWNKRMGAAFYFKHDSEQIQEIYRQYQNVLPSEIATQHWSKVLLEEQTELDFLLGLLDTAYALILKSMPKGEQAKIISLSTPNNIWAFHQLALRLATQDNHWHLDYNTGPQIRYRIKLIAKFEHHCLAVRGVEVAKIEDWEPHLLSAIEE